MKMWMQFNVMPRTLTVIKVMLVCWMQRWPNAMSVALFTATEICCRTIPSLPGARCVQPFSDTSSKVMYAQDYWDIDASRNEFEMYFCGFFIYTLTLLFLLFNCFHGLHHLRRSCIPCPCHVHVSKALSGCFPSAVQREWGPVASVSELMKALVVGLWRQWRPERWRQGIQWWSVTVTVAPCERGEDPELFEPSHCPS